MPTSSNRQLDLLGDQALDKEMGGALRAPPELVRPEVESNHQTLRGTRDCETRCIAILPPGHRPDTPPLGGVFCIVP